jgi:hypothetical protein
MAGNETETGAAAHPNTKHGHAGGRRGIGRRRVSESPTYTSWRAMVDRCTQPGHTAWARYGGAGITVCARWLGADGFKAFLADMGERSVGTTLDRIDRARGYEPGNCRWATPTEQTLNRSMTRTLTHSDGRVMALTEWARVAGVKAGTLWKRLQSGWSLEEAVAAPVSPHTPKHRKGGSR